MVYTKHYFVNGPQQTFLKFAFKVLSPSLAVLSQYGCQLSKALFSVVLFLQTHTYIYIKMNLDIGAMYTKQLVDLSLKYSINGVNRNHLAFDFYLIFDISKITRISF